MVGKDEKSFYSRPCVCKCCTAAIAFLSDQVTFLCVCARMQEEEGTAGVRILKSHNCSRVRNREVKNGSGQAVMTEDRTHDPPNRKQQLRPFSHSDFELLIQCHIIATSLG